MSNKRRCMNVHVFYCIEYLCFLLDQTCLQKEEITDQKIGQWEKI